MIELKILRQVIEELRTERKRVTTLDEQKVEGVVSLFDWAGEDLALAEALDETRWPVLIEAGSLMVELIEKIRSAKGLELERKQFDFDDPALALEHTTYVGDRIVSLQVHTRTRVSGAIRRAFAAPGGNAINLGTLRQTIITELAGTYSSFENFRADRIARTETAIAYNHGSIAGARQSNVRQVQVLDGDDDAECRDANGKIWSLEFANRNPVAHPNWSRAFAPVVEGL